MKTVLAIILAAGVLTLGAGLLVTTADAAPLSAPALSTPTPASTPTPTPDPAPGTLPYAGPAALAGLGLLCLKTRR
jgi:hypothetical protein